MYVRPASLLTTDYARYTSQLDEAAAGTKREAEAMVDEETAASAKRAKANDDAADDDDDMDDMEDVI